MGELLGNEVLLEVLVPSPLVRVGSEAYGYNLHCRPNPRKPVPTLSVPAPWTNPRPPSSTRTDAPVEFDHDGGHTGHRIQEVDTSLPWYGSVSQGQ